MPDFSHELNLRRQGWRTVVGVDEAGRGPLAGPVVAAAVILPAELSGEEAWLESVDDSKRLTAGQRATAYDLINRFALEVSVAEEPPDEIDRLGIGPAAIKAMLAAVQGLKVAPDYLLLDYVPLRQCPYPFEALIKGDSRSYSIAAASIIAKVTRDRIMQEAEATYPGYDFALNKGYGTAAHRERLARLGPCPMHRRSFSPLRQGLLPMGGD